MLADLPRSDKLICNIIVLGAYSEPVGLMPPVTAYGIS